MVTTLALVAALATSALCAAPPKSTPVCSKSPYSLLIPLSTYSSASLYCYSKYPVVAVTSTSTYTPISTSTALVIKAGRTITSTSTSVTAVSYTSTVSTISVQKRDPAENPRSSSSLSSRWQSLSSILSKSGTAVFSTACFCIETAVTVKAVSTASPVVQRVSRTSTSTKTTIVVIASTSSVLVPATATLAAAGSCSKLGSKYTDSTSKNAAQYNLFCKNSYARSSDNTINTLPNIATFESCIQKCSATTGCAAVDYLRSNSQCFLLSTNTDLTKTADTTTDSAANVNPPPAPGSAASLGPSYQAPNSSLTFAIAYGNVYSYPDSALISSATTSTFQDCLNSCSNSITCLLASRSRSTRSCLLFNTALQPQAKKLRVRDGTTPSDSDSASLNTTAIPACSSLSSPYTSSNGKSFNFGCNSINAIGNHGELLIRNQTGRAFSECMDLCSTTSGCVASTYFPSTNASNNVCYLLNSVLFGLDDSPNVNSAILASYTVPPQTCSALKSASPNITADYNNTYTLSCGQAYDTSSNFRNFTNVKYFKECVYICSDFTQCKAVDYNDATGLCMMMSSGGGSLTPTTNREVATIISASGSAGGCNLLGNPFSTAGKNYDTRCDSWLPFPNSYFQDFAPTGGIASMEKCINLCATTPTCRAVDYDATQTTCILMKNANQRNVTSYVAARTGGYHFAAVIPSAGSCEDLPIPYNSKNATQFELKCDYMPFFAASDVIQTIRRSVFGQCVDLCATTPGCDMAGYAGTNCFLLYDNAYSNALSPDLTWDVARLSVSTSNCGGVSGPYNTANGQVFDLRCYHAYGVGTTYNTIQVSNYQQCMDSCNLDPQCAGVNYFYQQTPTQACQFFTAGGDGMYSASAHSALIEGGGGTCGPLNTPYTSAANQTFDLHCNTNANPTPGNTISTQDLTGSNFRTCVDNCGNQSGCFYASFDRSNSTCYLLSADGSLGTSDNSFDTAVSTADPSCGLQSPYATTDNVAWDVHCGTFYYTPYDSTAGNFPNIITSVNTDTLQQCVDACDTNSTSCVAVNWKIQSKFCNLLNDISPGSRADVTANSATIRGTRPPPTSDCGLQSPYNSTRGLTWDVQCGNYYYSTYDPSTNTGVRTTISSTTSLTSFQQCVDTCDKTATCIAVNWTPSTTTCDLLYNISPGNQTSTTINTATLRGDRPQDPDDCSLSDPYTSASGLAWNVNCGNNYIIPFDPNKGYVNAITVTQQISTFQACAELCSRDYRCVAANFHFGIAQCELLDDISPGQEADLSVSTVYIESGSRDAPTQQQLLSPCFNGNSTVVTSDKSNSWYILPGYYYLEQGVQADQLTSSSFDNYVDCLNYCDNPDTKFMQYDGSNGDFAGTVNCHCLRQEPDYKGGYACFEDEGPGSVLGRPFPT